MNAAARRKLVTDLYCSKCFSFPTAERIKYHITSSHGVNSLPDALNATIKRENLLNYFMLVFKNVFTRSNFPSSFSTARIRAALA